MIHSLIGNYSLDEAMLECAAQGPIVKSMLVYQEPINPNSAFANFGSKLWGLDWDPYYCRRDNKKTTKFHNARNHRQKVRRVTSRL